jgi:hypothetical protein
MSLQVVDKVMIREGMRQVHKLPERHFGGNMAERLRKSCRDRLSIRMSSTELSFIYFTLFLMELIPMTWVWSKNLLWVDAAAAHKYVIGV